MRKASATVLSRIMKEDREKEYKNQGKVGKVKGKEKKIGNWKGRGKGKREMERERKGGEEREE